MTADKPTLSFQIRLFLSLVVFSCLLLGLVAYYLYHTLDQQLHRDLGARAQVQAREIAQIPSLIDAIQRHDAAALRQMGDRLRAQSDASYLVFGDRHAIHLYHSEHPDRVGTPMIGGDNREVLQGQTIITVRQGGIGLSLRSKAPVRDAQGAVIGIVSVGYLASHIAQLNARQVSQIVGFVALLLLALFLFSWAFSRRLKRQMFWLEPEQIGQLVRRQTALLAALYEGVIALDPARRIIAINQAARDMLAIPLPESALVGRPVGEVLHAVPDFFHASDAENRHDAICRFNQRQVIANRVTMLDGGEPQGWVISFRDKNDINTLSSQLSQVTRYADSLRIMRHEQLNWTATLAGMLHMKRYDEAVRYIEAQSAGSQALLDFLSARFPSPALCGLLLGKFAAAHEKGLLLTFDPACRLHQPLTRISESELMSILGNLLDNAVDASLAATPPGREVTLYLTDSHDELVIEVGDQGCGIDPALRASLFEAGVTSKPAGDHGIGLYLVSRYVTQAGGLIEVADNSPCGTLFSLFIPNPPPVAIT
ncbi:histidine kinase [Chimaeribacter arupi]|uniref:histidine kinase n=2 Tax=Yersiniaceae TaxID=1903411 RepID=A0A2N5EHK5_9GAMM|nr:MULTISPECIES: sensor histidine kinase [Yersiniaceae]MBS0971685.1 sensor histidine kinase [Nissabacter archeti]PLR29645.1 histidine kinase [Chimaeribacter arupi]PLR43602.1 histidine kinase [Chimaeribacter arupi]PLR44592.1 histidine kinase [Chimaeribacter arupi]